MYVILPTYYGVYILRNYIKRYKKSKRYGDIDGINLNVPKGPLKAPREVKNSANNNKF